MDDPWIDLASTPPLRRKVRLDMAAVELVGSRRGDTPSSRKGRLRCTVVGRALLAPRGTLRMTTGRKMSKMIILGTYFIFMLTHCGWVTRTLRFSVLKLVVNRKNSRFKLLLFTKLNIIESLGKVSDKTTGLQCVNLVNESDESRLHVSVTF